MRRIIAALTMLVMMFVALGAAQGPGGSLAQDDTVAPSLIPGTVIVDEWLDGFTPKGYGWREDDFGYDGHHYWTYASRKPHLVGIWRASLEPGLYKVLAKVPARHASTRKAVYKIQTADGWVKRVRNQYKSRGDWSSLGTHAFGATAQVRLRDKTLDPRGTGRKVAFDAVKFIPVEPPESPEPVEPPKPSEPPEPSEPPVITRLDVEPESDRAIVVFSLEEAGPARTEYREAGDTTWLAGPSETSSRYADHRQVIGDLEPGTGYELRVIAANDDGETTSSIVGFTTLA